MKRPLRFSCKVGGRIERRSWKGGERRKGEEEEEGVGAGGRGECGEEGEEEERGLVAKWAGG